ncbi:hypothetical protein [Haloarcula pellucida]|uniref:Uncharacterized protein n=1 Tax=Haloarcula pellucida TaxID=1427151 RepID=A0A830GJ09_9EURY|nr:hypothetical protein [Halomicroarcula pellucida]MBX0348663.1 hypothetical protein [Halomicroarcula pellucida]GGN92327.1 hypothetical protein GCM10009030_16470 [Halomicroarcula pellucida]
MSKQDTESVRAVFQTYEDDAELEHDREGGIMNHDELVNSGQTYREIRWFDRETVDAFDLTVLDEDHPLWCDEVEALERGDSLRVDELREGEDA